MMIESVDQVILKVLTTNSTDVTLRDDPNFKEIVIQPGASAIDCLAEHGLAFSVVIMNGDKTSRYLFDLGGLKGTIINNFNAFKIPPSKFEKVFISHGHYDHWGGLLSVANLLADGTEFILNPEGLHPRFSLKKELTGTKVDLSALDFETLKKEQKIRQLPDFPEEAFQKIAITKNFKLNYTNRPVNVIPGVITSGEITIYDEDELTKGMLTKKDGKIFHDTFRDELALYINIKEKGLVVLTGCGHTGIINTIKHGQKISGVDKIYAVIGGLHQNWASPQRISETLKILKTFNPKIICGMHCTGFKFISECMRNMPLQTVLAVVGTTFCF
jgi:7,8-dihydropterin-6-yl-methyl-4-(beta-D-ribofuranosyl)aminobenzene 5'-phosphate synthase